MKKNYKLIRKLGTVTYQFKFLSKNKSDLLWVWKLGSWSIDIKLKYGRNLSNLWSIVPLVWDRKKNNQARRQLLSAGV